MEGRSRRLIDTHISGRWLLRIMTRYKKRKGELDSDGVHSGSKTTSCELKNVPLRLKRKSFKEFIPPVMTYGCETWSLSNTQLEKRVTAKGRWREPWEESPRKTERVQTGSGNRVV